MKNSIKATYLLGIPAIKITGDYIDTLLLLGCIMESVAKNIMLEEGCSRDEAMSFVRELPNKLVYDGDKHNLSFSISSCR